MIDFTGLAAVLSGLAGIIVAIGTIILNRQKQRVVEYDGMEQELEQCSKARGAAMRHIRTLERGYADFGAEPPARPADLAPGYLARQRGRHRAGGAAPASDGGATAGEAGYEPADA